MRARVYSLGQALTGGPPLPGPLARIHADPALPVLAGELESIAAITAGVAACLRDPEALKAAEEDYARLYVGPQALPAPLWESVYRDPEHILFGQATLAVRAFYARHGFVFAERGTQPDDHISLELEFMWHLTVLSGKALEETEPDMARFTSLCAAQADFLETHLLQWAPQSFTLQLPHAETGLYAGLARLITEFIPCDAACIGEISHERE